MLIWCLAPDKMNAIFDLQRELIQVYAMPPLLTQLMADDESGSKKVELDKRATGLSLAANLARHSANGLDEAALTGDYEAIVHCLHVDVSHTLYLVGHPEAKTQEHTD